MASDEEIEQRIRQHEERRRGSDDEDALQSYKETAGEIHDELARRIREVDDAAATDADLAEVVEKLDRLEARLDDLEQRR